MPERKSRKKFNWKLWWALFGCITLLLAIGAVIAAMHHDLESRILEIGSMKRTYELHRPKDAANVKAMPLLIVLHGGMGTGASMARYTGFNAIADREKFIVVYPDALYANWNDGRNAEKIRAQHENVDDIAFISALIDALISEFQIDRSRVYVTGASNGGIMTFRAAIELSDRFAAAAAVIANLPENFAGTTQPKAPISMMIVNGTKDPLVPWEGGDVKIGPQRRGTVASTQVTTNYWVQFDGCGAPVESSVDPPSNDKDKDTHVVKRTYSGGKEGSEVVVIEIQGGGHAWPGRPQYLPKDFIGKASQDFDASEEIWTFFKSHSRVAASK